jgi:hypothetical protein
MSSPPAITQYHFEPAPTPRHATSALNRLCDRFWEWRWRRDDRRGEPACGRAALRTGRYHTYFRSSMPSPPADRRRRPGCGGPRDFTAASLHPRVVGIEIDPPLASVAEANRRRLRRSRAPVRGQRVAIDF